MTNNIYTWNNKRGGDKGITCRLDSFLISESIKMAGGKVRAVVLPSTGSNYWPIILEWENAGVNPCRPFRFEKLWLLQAYFPKKLHEWWEESPPIRGTRMYQFQQKIKLLKNNIKKWNKESFGNIFQEKQALEFKMQANQVQGMSMGFSEEL